MWAHLFYSHSDKKHKLWFIKCINIKSHFMVIIMMILTLERNLIFVCVFFLMLHCKLDSFEEKWQIKQRHLSDELLPNTWRSSHHYKYRDTVTGPQQCPNMIWFVAFLSCIGKSNNYKSFFFTAVVSVLNSFCIFMSSSRADWC